MNDATKKSLEVYRKQLEIFCKTIDNELAMQFLYNLIFSAYFDGANHFNHICVIQTDKEEEDSFFNLHD